MIDGLQVGGLISGIDTKTLIAQLVAAKLQPAEVLKERVESIEATKSSISTVVSKLKDLRSAAQTIDTSSEFLSYSTSSDDEDILTISADGSAAAGNYDIVVSSLAAERRMRSAAFASNTTTGLFGTGTLDIDSSTITVDGTDTLNSVASKINSSGADVTASILYDGTNYYLVVAGRSTGLSNSNVYVEGGGLALNLAQTQAAADASFSIDGLAVTSEDNVVTDALTGVTLNLKSADPLTTVSVQISQDNSGVKEKIDNFISAYNAVIDEINKLPSEIVLNLTKDKLYNKIFDEVSGLTGTFTGTSQIGLKTSDNLDGKLELDSSDFTDALNEDFYGVSLLFINDNSTFGVADQISDLIDDLVAFKSGDLSVRETTLQDQIDRYNKKIDALTESSESYKLRLQNQFARMEMAIAQLNANSGNFKSTL